jgi:hypothetical protein
MQNQSPVEAIINHHQSLFIQGQIMVHSFANHYLTMFFYYTLLADKKKKAAINQR